MDLDEPIHEYRTHLGHDGRFDMRQVLFTDALLVFEVAHVSIFIGVGRGIIMRLLQRKKVVFICFKARSALLS